MADDPNRAEQLDPSVLGEQVGDEGRPGDDFPPDRPLGVDDPSIVDHGIIARDDLESRDARRDEHDVDSDTPARGLIDPSGGGTDREPQLVADESSSPDQAAEAAAVHRVDDGDVPDEPGGGHG